MRKKTCVSCNYISRAEPTVSTACSHMDIYKLRTNHQFGPKTRTKLLKFNSEIHKKRVDQSSDKKREAHGAKKKKKKRGKKRPNRKDQIRPLWLEPLLSQRRVPLVHCPGQHKPNTADPGTGSQIPPQNRKLPIRNVSPSHVPCVYFRWENP